MKAWLLVLALLAPAAQAAVFSGTVSHVTDGDSLWVRPAAGGRPVELRLLDIDAPEGCQRFGPEATAALRKRLHRRTVRVRTEGRDSYGRQLARVEHRGQDVAAWMVREGYAWSSVFRGRQGPHASLEAKARAARRGLWAQPNPLEPRAFRKRFGPCR